MKSYKTLDGRGAEVEIAYGPCIFRVLPADVIIHGISIHDCKPGDKVMKVSVVFNRFGEGLAERLPR